MNFQLKIINSKKNKALKVLTATKLRLENAVKMARDFLATNDNEIAVKHGEIGEIQRVNADLKNSINQMEASIAETDKILNPGA